ncbi:hypothetical protein [Phaeovulum sp. W22_SRMD_FR3]|uniref:hypothetical protein n=1 Tax=Phaeovulum sp. W22_SRMD_FR3 TaxID=3240274 RepID=UPI003F948FD6
MKYLKLTATGCVAEYGVARALPEGAIAAPDSFDPAMAEQLYRTAGGDWVERPLCPVPVVVSGGIQISGCPEGVRAEVYDLDGTEHLASLTPDAAGLIAASLPEAGRYRIEVEGPEPLRPVAVEITVEIGVEIGVLP